MILHYNSMLKENSRKLRSSQTDAEQLLWSHLRRKQLCEVQFYRQKPLGSYIVDFYAPSAKLVIEVDGSQHFEYSSIKYDNKRNDYLLGLNLKVLRFDNLQVLTSTSNVLEVIHSAILDSRV